MATRMRDLAEEGFRAEVFAFKPHDVKIDAGHNPRDWRWENLDAAQRESMAQLQASILQNGVERPLLVRRPKGTEEIWLVDGERRLRAARALVEGAAEHVEGGWQGVVPVMLVIPEGEADCLLRALRANDGEPLTKMELGRAYKKLLSSEWSYTKERIALETGVRTRFVTEALALAEMPAAVQGMVERGEVAPAAALHQVKVSEGHAAEVLREKVDQARAEGKTLVRREKIVPRVECPRCSAIAKGGLVEFEGQQMCRLCVKDLKADIAQEAAAKAKAAKVRCPNCGEQVEALVAIDDPASVFSKVCQECFDEAKEAADKKAEAAGWPVEGKCAQLSEGSEERKRCLLDDLTEAVEGVLNEVTESCGARLDELEDSEVVEVSGVLLAAMEKALAGWKAER